MVSFECNGLNNEFKSNLDDWDTRKSKFINTWCLWNQYCTSYIHHHLFQFLFANHKVVNSTKALVQCSAKRCEMVTHVKL